MERVRDRLVFLSIAGVAFLVDHDQSPVGWFVSPLNALHVCIVLFCNFTFLLLCSLHEQTIKPAPSTIPHLRDH